MKKLTAVIVSAFVGLAPLPGVAAAQDKAPVKKADRQVEKRQWKKGGKYDGRGTTVTNHAQHKLKAPPKGYRWVRDGNQFVLVAAATGIIASVVRAAED
jgi:Ni/Co efflux regulator RcnB